MAARLSAASNWRVERNIEDDQKANRLETLKEILNTTSDISYHITREYNERI